MCNLYRMSAGVAEIARMFGASAAEGMNVATEIYPGYPGLVVADGQIQQMTWGFPLSLTGKQGQKLKPKAVTNAREDKLHTAFWRDSFTKRRCLIPVTQWAEAEGEKGKMTRTWYAMPGDGPFAVAGLWRLTVEWGNAYSMVMVDSCGYMVDVHDRMPVLLTADMWEPWTTGTPQEAFDLCKTWAGELLVEKTQDRWAGAR